MATYSRRRASSALRSSPLSVFRQILGTALQGCTLDERDLLISKLRASDWEYLLSWADTVSPQKYATPGSYFQGCQISALIAKYPRLPIKDLDPESAAKKKFFKSEHRCRRYNAILPARRKLRIAADGQFWSDARSYIERVIGLTPNLERIYDQCDFTAGANVGIHGNKTNAARKIFASRWTCTPTALPYAVEALWRHSHIRDCILPGTIKCYDPGEFLEIVRRKIDYVCCNNIAFVPKSAKTYRSIALEPTLNGFVQKGVDLELRALLKKRVGLDLTDQETNSHLAMLGSTGGFNPYCTIDLSAASDSISVEVARELLPPEWFAFLSDLRSTHYKMDGKVTPYQKFCSMGNGFCFPLQTLLFASVCYAAEKYCGPAEYDFSVYGDDIIVRQSQAALVIEKLRSIGFQTNVDKTFLTGPFRESCGRDWYDGQDVRPVHLRNEITSLRGLFAFHNSTYRSERTELFFEEVRSKLRSLGGGSYLRPGREPGDTCFSVSLDLAMSSRLVSWDRRLQSWRWREFVSRPVSDRLLLSDEQLANAVMYAALRGSPSNCPYSVRYETTEATVSVSRPWSDRYVRSWHGSHVAS